MASNTWKPWKPCVWCIWYHSANSAQNTLRVILVISQSLYKTKREKLIALCAFHDDWAQSELVVSMSPVHDSGEWWQECSSRKLQKKYQINRKALAQLANWAGTAAKPRAHWTQFAVALGQINFSNSWNNYTFMSRPTINKWVVTHTLRNAALRNE